MCALFPKLGYNAKGPSSKEASTIRTNFHSHTTRCQHARGSDIEYVLAAIEAGYSQLGFSDHSPWPYKDGFVSRIRMAVSELPAYLASVASLKEAFKDDIAIYTGLEAEFYPEHQAWLSELRDESLDFLLLGSHFDRPDEPLYFGSCVEPAELARYARHTIKGMESGLFDCLAHPDLFMMNYQRFDDNCQAVSLDLIRASKALKVPLEYNLSGLYPQSWRQGAGYPAPEFWELAAAENATVIVGLDAHDPLRYADTGVYDKAVRQLSGMGLTVLGSLTDSPARPLRRAQ